MKNEGFNDDEDTRQIFKLRIKIGWLRSDIIWIKFYEHFLANPSELGEGETRLIKDSGVKCEVGEEIWVEKRFISEDFFLAPNQNQKGRESQNIIERSRTTKKKILRVRIKKWRNFSEVYCVTQFSTYQKKLCLNFLSLLITSRKFSTNFIHCAKNQIICLLASSMPMINSFPQDKNPKWAWKFPKCPYFRSSCLLIWIKICGWI